MKSEWCGNSEFLLGFLLWHLRLLLSLFAVLLLDLVLRRWRPRPLPPVTTPRPRPPLSPLLGPRSPPRRPTAMPRTPIPTPTSPPLSTPPPFPTLITSVPTPPPLPTPTSPPFLTPSPSLPTSVSLHSSFVLVLPPLLELLVPLLSHPLPLLGDAVDGGLQSSVANVLLAHEVVVDSLLGVADDQEGPARVAHLHGLLLRRELLLQEWHHRPS